MASDSSSTTRTPAQERAFSLMAERDLVDEQLQAHISTLTSHGVNMSTRLVDGQGFPRADLDLVAIRTARVRVIELRNDRTRLTNEIAQALSDVHSSPLSQPASEVKTNGINGTLEPSPAGTPGVSEVPRLLIPFAKVDGVAPGSPAQQSGLQREDLILSFGDLTARSFSGSSLQPLAQLVASHENRPLNVKIKRNGSEMSLSFTPRSGWGGRGMLG
ncbi:putative 26S proteasome regulatory subunit [Ceratobasidium sp. 428]|nr:putative 26S proteasome regulatory subunit [Ceratobasidium sp. 428]